MRFQGVELSPVSDNGPCGLKYRQYACILGFLSFGLGVGASIAGCPDSTGFGIHAYNFEPGLGQT